MKKIAHHKWVRNMGMPEEEACRLEFLKMRNQVKYKMRKARRDYEKEIASKSKEKPKQFWHYARKMLKTRCNISPLRKDPNDRDTLCFDDAEKANILQQQFLSVFTSLLMNFTKGGRHKKIWENLGKIQLDFSNAVFMESHVQTSRKNFS